MPSHLGAFACDLSAKQCAEATASSTNGGALSRGASLEELRFVGSNPNLSWELDWDRASTLESSRPIDSLSEDLLAVASHVYQADRLVKRPETPPREWYREIELHIGVEHDDKWNERASELAQLLKTATHDTFRLSFYHRNLPRPALSLPATAPAVHGGIGVLSTHFNSVFGVASENLHGDLIASVRYGYDSPKSGHSGLIKAIGKVTHTLPVISFSLKPKGLRRTERTQRTQGLLQVALAATIARRLGFSKIQVFDDGVSAYHLRSRQICGPGFAVRDCRPDFLWQARQALQQLGIVPNLEIQNPFQFFTAVEVLNAVSPKTAAQDLLALTDSCLDTNLAKALRPSWKGSVPHCGCCFPCKVRRLAALAAGLETRGGHATYYSIDPLSPAVPPAAMGQLSAHHQRRVQEYHDKGKPDLKDYLQRFQHSPSAMADPQLSREILDLSTEKFLFAAPPNASPATPTNIFAWIVGVHHRFHQQVKRFL